MKFRYTAALVETILCHLDFEIPPQFVVRDIEDPPERVVSSRSSKWSLEDSICQRADVELSLGRLLSVSPQTGGVVMLVKVMGYGVKELQVPGLVAADVMACVQRGIRWIVADLNWGLREYYQGATTERTVPGNQGAYGVEPGAYADAESNGRENPQGSRWHQDNESWGRGGYRGSGNRPDRSGLGREPDEGYAPGLVCFDEG